MAKQDKTRRSSYNSRHRDILQKVALKLNRLITEYGLIICVQKIKSMSFKGRDPVITKIAVDNKIIEQKNHSIIYEI
jgi:hypothetical protein